jgi:Zn-dependent peptidase ImmA (M78 family)
VIVLNESDLPTIKVFSLFHELCHLLRDEQGICSIEPDSEVNDAERYCDTFAAEFLVPKESLIEIVKRNPSDDRIWSLANEYGVSKQVIMLRLLSLGYITVSRYKKFRESFREEKLKIPVKRPQDWTKRYAKRLGSIVVSEVSKAYKRGDITFSEAADILNVKIKYAEKLLG